MKIYLIIIGVGFGISAILQIWIWHLNKKLQKLNDESDWLDGEIEYKEKKSHESTQE